MKLKAAFLLSAIVSAILLVTSCGGGSGGDGGGTSQTPPQQTTPDSGGGGSTSGTSTGNGGASCPTPGPSSDTAITSSYDAPLVYLAQPGPITATLLTTPAPDPSSSFSTSYVFQDQSHNTIVQDLGITSNDIPGKSVMTVSIPGQPAGIPIVLGTHVSSGITVFGTVILTGWVTGSNFSCCDGQPKVRAQVEFGANNTAIVTYGGSSPYLPNRWATNPLRIQFTNVTSSYSL